MAGLTEQDTNDSCLLCEQLKDRTKTYTIHPPWKGPLEAQLMAEAGFVYAGQEDLVYCFSCNIKLDGWTKHMDPLLRHKEESPTCSFVRQQLQVIKGEKRKVKSVVAPSKPLNPWQTASIGQLVHVTHSPVKYAMVTGLCELRLPNEQTDHNHFEAVNYQSLEKRIRSFTEWPLKNLFHPEQLARAGFVYTGEGSLVQCFQCGVRYRNWLKGDVPLSVHQKCNPRCAFLQRLSCQSKIRPSKHLNRPSQIPEDVPTLQKPNLQGSSNKQGQLSNTLKSSADSKRKDDHHNVTFGVCTAQHTVVSTV